MKNKILLVCAGFMLLIFLTYGTYSWYNYFLKITAASSTITNYKIGDIEFKEDGKGVYDANAESIDDIKIDEVPAYNFSVVNHGDSEKEYILYIEDVPANLVDDGCTEDKLLSRSDLKYQLKLNNNVIKEDFLSNIQDNILDTRKLEAKKTNTYSLKVYIHDGALDWFSKHYHYKVVLKK